MHRRGATRVASWEMPCLVLLLAVLSPRLALIALWLFDDLLSRAFDGWLVPLIGFFVLPWTTLAFGGMWWNDTSEVAGIEWAVVAFAFLLDLGVVGGARGRRRR